MAIAIPHTICLAMESKDQLSSLPSELLYHIFNYLFANHKPDLAFENRPTPPQLAIHPLLQLAQSSRRLKIETHQWSLHFIKQHSNATHYKPLKTSKRQNERVYLRELLKWSQIHCVFCGKKSVRSAILMNSYRCCGSCDKDQWPDKITRTEAKQEFDLRDHHLLPHKYVAPANSRTQSAESRCLPRLRYGTYLSSNVVTTIFLRADVRRLAELIHGDVELHMKRRDQAREERKQKREELTRKKQEQEERRREVDEELNRPFARAARLGLSNVDAFKILADLWRRRGGGLRASE